ncbi:hypothetical protein AK812_SmicGene20130 [Symbiodinium microadriaticum]|uniref:Uncharacterized protein n=1 Tax=Symbiodinium microadriaticum TaxID=2951 RepID=A0A1Q9DQV1_SYMMI|nr:hypothetical protein AK812_SmicGene20130 [Symbiodinium microadriaticum]
MFGVGITDYSWRRLPNAKPEVECLGRSFGCRGYDCYILLDAQESEDVKKFLADLQVSEFTKVLCGYVAAHGVETVDGNVRILLMSSTNEQDADAQHWVTVDDLCNILLTLSCSEDADVYLFLNFCRCQVATSCMEKNGHVQTKRKSLSRKIHIMWACASGQAALEGKPGDFSPFAACLMPLLQEDRDWSFQDLFNKLQPAVSTQSRAACNGFLRPQQLTLTQSAAASYGIFTADAKPKAPRLVGVPAANETFTGRARELELIQTTFNKAAGQCAIVQTRAITGLGGIGKTQLAKAFVYMHQHMYDVVLWIDAERDLATSFRSCAASLVELGPDLTPMQVKAKLDDHLRQYKYWLIIFDNVEKTADIEPYRPAGTGHVLITSRYQLWNKGSTVELGRLARIDAVVLLYRKIFSDDAAAMDTAKAHVRDSLLPWDSQDPADRSAQPPACVPADVVQCWELAALLDDFPLALVQASAAIRFFGFATIHDYCEEYRTAYSSLQKEEEDSLDPGYADGYNRSVHATLKIILSKLAQRDMNHTSASERVLGAVALLDAAIIPHNLLVALVEEMCPELTSNVQKLGVLGNLWRCSLISRLTEDLLDKSTSGNCQQDYTVHRVVQQFVLCQMDQDSRHEAVHGVSKVLNSLLKRSLHESPETVKENRLLLPHVRALTASDKDVQELKDRDPIVLGNLLCLAADFYVHEQRDRKTAKHFLDMADRHSPSATSDAMLQLSVRLLGLQCMFKENLEGNVAEAESHLLQALRLCPDQSPLRAELLHLKGNLKYRQQKFEEAQRYMEEALEMKKQHPAEYNQASLAYSEHGLGNVYAKMHQIFRADTAYAHAIENKVSFYRCEDHLDVARSQCRQVKNMLDQRLMSTADRMKAFQLMMNVVTVFERDLDEEHYEVINA